MSTDQNIPDDHGNLVCVCANLRRATRLVTQSYDAALRPAGLRATQFTILAVLGKRGQMRQSQLADILGMDGTTLTRNLRPLVKHDWIRIERDDDRRVRLISITKQGQHVLDEAMPLWRQVQSRFVTGLGTEQWPDFVGSLGTAADIAHRD